MQERSSTINVNMIHPKWLITTICLRNVLILSSFKRTQKHRYIIETNAIIEDKRKPKCSFCIKIMKLIEK